MKRSAIATAVLIMLNGGQAWATDFDIGNTQTLTATQTLESGETGSIDQGGSLTIGSGNAIVVDGSATIVNNGTITDTDDKAIEDDSGHNTITITNGATGQIIDTVDDGLHFSKATNNITFNNAGLVSATGGQAVDWNGITSGTNVLNNLATGTLEATDADAVRPGVNGIVNNDGNIHSVIVTDIGGGDDGIDAQQNSGITIVNATTGSATVAGTGLIEGARHGITGGAVDALTPFTMSITNNKGGTIQGDDGSGINIDGFNASEVVTIVNHGTITGNGVSGDGDGVDVDGLVQLTNTGTIISKQAFQDTSEGVTVGGGTIINSGLIEGDNVNGGVGRGITLAGVDKDANGNPQPPEAIYADTTVTNSGTIKGQSDSGIAMTGARGTFKVTINNLAGGTIEGGGATAAAIAAGATDTTIVNAGTIVADQSGVAIDFGSSNSSLQITGGAAKVIGDIKGGTGTSTVTITPGAGNRFSYDGAMSALSSVDIGAGTVDLNGNNTYTGTTTVETGGTLAVNGTVASALAVNSGGTLAGNGTVGTVTLADGAILAPGSIGADGSNGIGTLTVNGNLSLAHGSVYQVQADPTGTDSDLVHVTGTANLAGSVVHVGPDGNFAPFRTYTILTADGGLNGTFDSVQSDFAFLTPGLDYGQNNVDLTLRRNEAPFASLAQNGNQRATAAALDTLPPSNALYDHIVTLGAAQAPAAFAALSGETHATAVTSLQTVSQTVTSLPVSHLLANLDAGTQPGPATAQLGNGDASALPTSAAHPIWAQVFGNWSTLGGNDGTAKTSQTDGGIFAGGDAAVGNGWRVGGALGYTGSHSTSDLSSTADIDSYTATVYGGKAFAAGPGNIKLSGGAAYTWHDIHTKRDTAGAGLDETLKSDYSASTGQIFGELGYALPLAGKVTIEPFVGADWDNLRTRGFDETGGDAALSGKGDSNDVTTTTLGVHASTDFQAGKMQGTLHGTVGWRHAFGDVDPVATMAFQDSQSFTVSGAPVARDAAALELGVDVKVSRNTTVGVSYNGQFGGGDQQNAGIINVNWRF